MSNDNDNARKLDKSRDATRTKEVIEALNAPGNLVSEWWSYMIFWKINWDVINLETCKYRMWEA
jgi:hypothetical protein